MYQFAFSHRKRRITKALENSLKRSCSNTGDAILSLLSNYHINGSVSDDVASSNVLVLGFANDLCFYLCSEVISRQFPDTTYVDARRQPVFRV